MERFQERSSPALANRSCLTFLTDFGSKDTYVGQMKGVALGINPDVQLVDLTHEIPPQQIEFAAFVWADAARVFPTGAIHVGVVDPGVGSNRRLIAAEIGEHRFVCPDNGLLSCVLKSAPLHRVVMLDERKWWREPVSNTFHGRDILTPVAAALSLGHDLGEVGSPLTGPLVTLSQSELKRGRTSLAGTVVDIDHFGNLVTNVSAGDLPVDATEIQIDVGLFRISTISRCYSDVESGEPVVLVGSSDRLEIAIRNGSAADEFQIGTGHRIAVRWKVPS